MKEIHTMTAYTVSFVDELSKAGLTDIVISPGSRSTPLAQAFAAHPNIKSWINIDERSAGFFALGIAKETRRPVALLCTSGTAAANYFPAVCEANLSRVPLIVLTADRPHELRGVGAPQAMDQMNMYGSHAKYYKEMAIPDKTDVALDAVRSEACHAFAVARENPAGPVQLNFPLRDPLMIDFDQVDQFITNSEPKTTVGSGLTSLTLAQAQAIAGYLAQYKKGVIVLGPIDHPDLKNAVERLSIATSFPILASPLSQARSNTNSENVIDGYNAILKVEEVAEELQPEVIIRIGALPVPKQMIQFIEKSDAQQVVIDATLGWRDPARQADYMITCDEAMFCMQLAEIFPRHQDTTYLDKWKKFNAVANESITKNTMDTEIEESEIFVKLTGLLPLEANLFISNSMPIRYLDETFAKTQRNIRIFANRGANGIDGIISTALGVAANSIKPTYLVVGDLSFIHDMNSLVAAKMSGLELNIIVINNDGGGIFSFLPQKGEPREFEKLFGTPHGISFEGIAEMFDVRYRKVTTWTEFEGAYKEFQGAGKIRVIEAMSNRDANIDYCTKKNEVISKDIRRAFNE